MIVVEVTLPKDFLSTNQVATVTQTHVKKNWIYEIFIFQINI